MCVCGVGVERERQRMLNNNNVCSVAQSCLTLRPDGLQLTRLGLQPIRLLCACNFLGRNTGASCHFLFQWIFPTQGLNQSLLCLLHYQHPVHHQLLDFTQTHVHRVGDAIQPSHPLIPFSSCPQSLPASGSFPMSQLFA